MLPYAAETARAQCGREPRRRRWVELDASDIGRPRGRGFKKNPVPGPQNMFNTGSTIASAAAAASNAISSLGLELVQWDLHDSWAAVGSTTLQDVVLFSSGQGQPYNIQGGAAPFPNKTPLQSNIQTQNGVLPAPQSFLLRGMSQVATGTGAGAATAPIAVLDLHNLAFNTLATVKCGDVNRIYFQSFWGDVPTAQNTIYGAGGALAGISELGIGWPSIHNVYSLMTGLWDPNIGAVDQGIVINQMRLFQHILQFGQNPIIGTAGWATVATNGVVNAVKWHGVLARSMAG
jgi:hypothetical protein